MCVRSHRQGRSMSGLSAVASIWNCCRRSRSVARSHWPNATVQNARSLIVFVSGVDGDAAGRAFASRVGFA